MAPPPTFFTAAIPKRTTPSGLPSSSLGRSSGRGTEKCLWERLTLTASTVMPALRVSITYASTLSVFAASTVISAAMYSGR